MLNYPRTYHEAVAWQEARREEVRLTPLPRPPVLVGGAYACYDRADKRVYGALAVFTYPDLTLVEEAAGDGPAPSPTYRGC
jgi:hypothetical protein